MQVTRNSILFAFIIVTCVTFFLYVKQGMVTLNSDVIKALGDIFYFWFGIVWNFTLLVALFRSIKSIFNHCYNGYIFELRSCSKEKQEEVIREIGYGDLIKVWRKWFMLLIWLVASQMVIALVFTLLFSTYSGLFEWFNIYVLYAFVLIGGYFSFMILGSRCKQVKVKRC